MVKSDFLSSEWWRDNLKRCGVPRRRALLILALLTVALGLRVVAMSGVTLLPEEAYYWMYSQHPALSYFDHPPMVAWLIGAGTSVFGDTEFGVRFGGAVLMLVSSVLMYVFGTIWFGRAAGLAAALLLQILPVYFGTGLIATMDSALVFFWMTGLAGVSFALRDLRAWGWYLAAFGLGGAMLSKYTGVFIGVGALLAVVTYPPWRRHLRTLHPYLAALLALAMFSPVLIWNAQHGWVSFRFQFADRFYGKSFNPVTVASFVGLQVLVATPLVLACLGFLYARKTHKWRRLFTPRNVVALSFSLPLLMVMSYKSLRYDIHLNWTLPLYLSVLPAAARFCLVQWRRARRGLVRFAWPRVALSTVVGCLAVNVLSLVYVLAVQPRTGWINAMDSWCKLAAVVEAVEEQLEAETGIEPLVIADGKYRLASVLAFYRTTLENDVRSSDFTTSQWVAGGNGLGYPYWVKPWDKSACIIVDDDNDIDQFAPLFQHFKIVKQVRFTGKRKFQIAIAQGWRGVE